MQLFENTSIDKSRAAFAAQFEPRGQGFLYRRDQRGPAKPVSLEERNRFVRDYAWKSFAGSAVFVGSLVACIYFIGTFAYEMNPRPADETIFLVIGVVCLLLLWGAITFIRSQWSRPDQALVHRVPVQVERSEEEAMDAKLEKTSWTRLSVGGAGVTAFLAVKFHNKYDLTQGAGLVLLGILAVGGAVLVYQTYRKWSRRGRR